MLRAKDYSAVSSLYYLILVQWDVFLSHLVDDDAYDYDRDDDVTFSTRV